MTSIRHHDLVQSVADALQFISYYHPRDYIQALGRAEWQKKIVELKLPVAAA